MCYAGSPGPMMRNMPRFDSRWPNSIPLGPELLAHAMTVMAQMDGRSDLHMAVSRWKNSGVALDAANRMIDLRAVLECLYAQDANQELAFRIALCGARRGPVAAVRSVTRLVLQLPSRARLRPERASEVRLTAGPKCSLPLPASHIFQPWSSAYPAYAISGKSPTSCTSATESAGSSLRRTPLESVTSKVRLQNSPLATTQVFDSIALQTGH